MGDTVQLSYIVGAGHSVSPFGLLSCQRSGNTLESPLTLPHVGGVISQPIPSTRVGEQIPAIAASVTFEVRCTFIASQNSTVIFRPLSAFKVRPKRRMILKV